VVDEHPDSPNVAVKLYNARLLVPQRPLTYTLTLPGGEGVTVRAVPDLLAFFRARRR